MTSFRGRNGQAFLRRSRNGPALPLLRRFDLKDFGGDGLFRWGTFEPEAKELALAILAVVLPAAEALELVDPFTREWIANKARPGQAWGPWKETEILAWAKQHQERKPMSNGTESSRKFRRGILKCRKAAEEIDAFLWDIEDIEDDDVAEALKGAREANKVLEDRLAEADGAAVRVRPSRDVASGIQRPIGFDDDTEGDAAH